MPQPRDEATVPQKACPKLKKPGHAKWYARFDVPTADGKRRQVRIEPFRTRAEAQETLRHEISRISYGGVPSAHKITVE
nr:Arm DNA-binding domain-containing protein [Nocardiopsis sp. CNR-923]